MIILTLLFLLAMVPVVIVIAVFACHISTPRPDADELLRKLGGE